MKLEFFEVSSSGESNSQGLHDSESMDFSSFGQI